MDGSALARCLATCFRSVSSSSSELMSGYACRRSALHTRISVSMPPRSCACICSSSSFGPRSRILRRCAEASGTRTNSTSSITSSSSSSSSSSFRFPPAGSASAFGSRTSPGAMDTGTGDRGSGSAAVSDVSSAGRSSCSSAICAIVGGAEADGSTSSAGSPSSDSAAAGGGAAGLPIQSSPMPAISFRCPTRPLPGGSNSDAGSARILGGL